MKKTLIIIGTIISLTSCSKEQQIISKAEEFLKKDLLDPKSYEVIESRLDTIYTSNNLRGSAETDSIIGNLYLERAKDETKYAKIWVSSTTEYGMSNFNDRMLKGRQYIDSTRKYMDRSDSLKRKSQSIKGTEQDSIYRFSVRLKYYSVNKDGQRGISTSYIGIHRTGEPVEVFTLK